MAETQSLGELLKRLRMAAGFNQRQLAERLKINSTYLSHLEANRREPSIQLLRRLAAELNIPPGVLIAVTLWTELPPSEQEPYHELIDSLLKLATAIQLQQQQAR